MENDKFLEEIIKISQEAKQRLQTPMILEGLRYNQKYKLPKENVLQYLKGKYLGISE